MSGDHASFVVGTVTEATIAQFVILLVNIRSLLSMSWSVGHKLQLECTSHNVNIQSKLNYLMRDNFFNNQTLLYTDCNEPKKYSLRCQTFDR